MVVMEQVALAFNFQNSLKIPSYGDKINKEKTPETSSVESDVKESIKP